MRRPKRKVARVEDVTRKETDVQGREREVALWKCTLACGHVVFLSRRKRYRAPKAWRCAQCQGQKVAA